MNNYIKKLLNYIIYFFLYNEVYNIKMEKLYKGLQNDANLCLKSIYPIPSTNNLTNTHTRFLTQSITSVIEDLIQCIYLRVSKREKRIKRLKFLIQQFKDDISIDIYNESIEILNGTNKHKFNNTEVINEQSFNKLKIENKRENIEGDELIFEKFNIDSYQIPEKTIFNNYCKDILNDDGSVYDIFTYVIVIAFYTFINDVNRLDNTRSNELLKLLISDATIIFKGGASIGKFLFINNNKLWSSLSNTDKIYVFDNFIKGGDNDTNIHFNLIPNKEYTIDDINEGISRVLFEIVKYLKTVIKEYNIYEIIQYKLSPINNSIMSYDNQEFIFKNAKSQSYAIVEKNASQITPVFFNIKENQLYITNTYVEFKNNNKELIKFYLTRVKACFNVEHRNNSIFSLFQSDFNFNCYAECLDISALCVDSAINYHPTYIDANII